MSVNEKNKEIIAGLSSAGLFAAPSLLNRFFDIDILLSIPIWCVILLCFNVRLRIYIRPVYLWVFAIASMLVQKFGILDKELAVLCCLIAITGLIYLFADKKSAMPKTIYEKSDVYTFSLIVIICFFFRKYYSVPFEMTSGAFLFWASLSLSERIFKT